MARAVRCCSCGVCTASLSGVQGQQNILHFFWVPWSWGGPRDACVWSQDGAQLLCIPFFIRLGDTGGRGVRAGWSLLPLQEWRFGGRKHTVGCWFVGVVERWQAVCELVEPERQCSLPFPSMCPLRILLQVGSITLELSCPATLLWGSLGDSRKRRKRLILVNIICGKAGIDDFRMGSNDPIPVII